MSGASQLKNNLEFVSLMTTTSFDNFNLWKVGKIRGFYHDTSYYGLRWDDFWFKTGGIVTDWQDLLISSNARDKWMSVLEDCPDEFHTNEWLNVFESKHKHLSKRTGELWLHNASNTRMIEKLKGKGMYKKGLGILLPDSIDEEEK